MLQPFSPIGTALDISIHQIFQLYDWLLDGKINLKTKARNSHDSGNWGCTRKYYSKTKGDTGTFYNLGATLNPSMKLCILYMK